MAIEAVTTLSGGIKCDKCGMIPSGQYTAPLNRVASIRGEGHLDPKVRVRISFGNSLPILPLIRISGFSPTALSSQNLKLPYIGYFAQKAGYMGTNSIKYLILNYKSVPKSPFLPWVHLGTLGTTFTVLLNLYPMYPTCTQDFFAFWVQNKCLYSVCYVICTHVPSFRHVFLHMCAGA